VIKAGAATEVELKERKHRIEDAVRNAKAAVEEGIVPGGGVALLQSAPALDDLKLEGDEATGANIVRVALGAPLKQIAFNAGLEPGVVAEKVSNLPTGQGLNADSGVYDYAARYTAGITEFFAPARLTADEAKAVEQLAVRAHTTLGLSCVSRTDLILDADGTPWFLEVNVAPGLTETSLLPMAAGAADLDLGVLYRDLVQAVIGK